MANAHGAAGKTPKVRWTDTEKQKIVSHAIEVQREHPDLSGLSLLRVAMQILPVTRRRRLIATTQAPFFEPAVAAETKRLTTEAMNSMSVVPFARASAAASAAIRDNQQRFLEFHKEWRKEEAQRSQEQADILAGVLHELQILNAKLGLPVPARSGLTATTAHRPTNGKSIRT